MSCTLFSHAFLCQEGFHATGIAINHLLPTALEREAADTSYSIESIQIGAIFRRAQNGFFPHFAMRVQSLGAIFAYRHYRASAGCLSVCVSDLTYVRLPIDTERFFAVRCMINDSDVRVLLSVTSEVLVRLKFFYWFDIFYRNRSTYDIRFCISNSMFYTSNSTNLKEFIVFSDTVTTVLIILSLICKNCIKSMIYVGNSKVGFIEMKNI